MTDLQKLIIFFLVITVFFFGTTMYYYNKAKKAILLMAEMNLVVNRHELVLHLIQYGKYAGPHALTYDANEITKWINEKQPSLAIKK